MQREKFTGAAPLALRHPPCFTCGGDLQTTQAYRLPWLLVFVGRLLLLAAFTLLLIGGCLFLFLLAYAVEQAIRAPGSAFTQTMEPPPSVEQKSASALDEFNGDRPIRMDRANDWEASEDVSSDLAVHQHAATRNRILIFLLTGVYAMVIPLPWIAIGIPGLIVGRLLTSRSLVLRCSCCGTTYRRRGG